MNLFDTRAHRATGKKKGPRPTNGAVKRWILEALIAGDKTTDEIRMGCAFDGKVVAVTLNKLKGDGFVRPALDGSGQPREKIRNSKDCFVNVWQVNPNRRQEIVDGLNSDPVLYEAKLARTNPNRELDNAFFGIVAGRVAQTG